MSKAPFQHPATSYQPIRHPVHSGLLLRLNGTNDDTSVAGGRECAESGKKRPRTLQRRATGPEPDAVPAIVHEVLRSPGQPLDPATRAFMEPRFGHDFSRVRVHTDAQAANSARAVQALAFTVGNELVFREGQYSPATTAGRKLLAHELTHVMQQSGSSDTQRVGNTEFSQAGAEREAESVAVAVVAGGPAAAHPRSVVARGIQRVATWKVAKPLEVINLADVLLAGGVHANQPAGNSEALLNTWNASAGYLNINKPGLVFGTTQTGNVTAKVDTVPTNIGSFKQTVLKPGPWTLTVPKVRIGRMWPIMVACQGLGNTKFTTFGDHQYLETLQHENHHVADFKDAFTATIVAWDAKLTAAQTAGTTFNGATEADARTALFGAMGGTPEEVANDYVSKTWKARDLFHATPAGAGVPKSINHSANSDCSQSSVEIPGTASWGFLRPNLPTFP